MSRQTRITATEQGWDLGFSYVPLNGKRPVQKNWTDRDREDKDQAIAWATKGNVGIRTGKCSGFLVVVDVDNGADLSSMDFPDTVTVITGSGGRHFYYIYEGEIRNSAGKLGAKIDIRADGGQVVAVGSVHPDTKKVYRYARDLSPDDIEIQPLPEWILTDIKNKSRQRRSEASSPEIQGNTQTGAVGYASAALKYELENLRSAQEGERNDQLNRSAFALGTLIGAGALDGGEVEVLLLDASIEIGLTEKEAFATIKSAISSGTRSPREIPSGTREEQTGVKDSPPTKRSAVPPPPPIIRSKARASREVVLTPGTHVTKFGYQEIGADAFADEVLKALPSDLVYRRGGIPVEIVGEAGRKRLNALTPDRMRLIMDQNIRLVWCCRKSNKLQQVYKNATRDWAKIVLASAVDSRFVRDLNLFTNYPVYDRNWDLVRPGWFNGTYYDQPPELKGVEAGGSWASLEDLLVDFPFLSEADEQNFISLMLTPMIRPAILGNVPLFLIKSSLPRTGKTKLAEQVTGGVYLGEETPAMQWSSNEDERDKRILSILKQGDTILHVDNVAHYVDSPALASLVTSRYYSGRLLGQSQMMRLENNLTIVATANNPRATGEIVRRAIPITLQPEDDAPELRSTFKHPQLFKYVLKRRPRIWAVMMKLVENWKEAGRPSTSAKMGGFEGWISSMSGIMMLAGADRWMTNWRSWVKQADPEGEDLKDLCSIWKTNYGNSITHAKEILQIAEENDLFGPLLNKSRTTQGRLTLFATGILQKYMDAPVEDMMIRRGAGRTYFLEIKKGELFNE